MTDADLAGWLLLGSFLLWLPAAALPQRIWTAPAAERLALVAAHRGRWRAVNLCIAAAAVLLALGFAALAEPLRQEGAGVLVPLSLAAMLVGTALWLASLAFRLTAMAAPGAGASAAFTAVSAWAGGLFLLWSVLGNAAVAGFGAAIVQSGYPAVWCGWAAIALAGLMLVQLLATGDALPALYHVGPLLIGVALLVD